MRQRYDTTYLEMLQMADYILLDGVNTSRSIVPDKQIAFSARYIIGLRLVSASAILTEISPRFEGVSESGYSGTQSVALAFMDRSDCRMETERIDSEYQW